MLTKISKNVIVIRRNSSEKLNNNMKPYTYLIKFKPTGQCYYGSRYKNVRLGINPEDDLMIKYQTSSKDINDLIAQYSLEAFEWEVRRTFDTAEQAIDWETRVLKRCKVLESEKWFNGNIAGYILPTEESRKKISDYHKGKPKSEEHKKNLSKSQKGSKRPWSINNLPNDTKGEKNGRYGKEVTNETRQKISESNKGRMAPNKGVPMTEEQKAKIRATKAAKPTKRSAEAIAKTVAKQKGQTRPKLYCEHCKRDIAQGWFHRHGPNCKSKS